MHLNHESNNLDDVTIGGTTPTSEIAGAGSGPSDVVSGLRDPLRRVVPQRHPSAPFTKSLTM
jgi:hypothetical protein